MHLERDLVIALCRTGLPDSAHVRVRNLAARIGDWDPFFDLAIRWEMEPVVMANLIAICGDMLPAHVLSNAGQRGRDARAIALARTLLVVQTVKRLSAAGVEAIVLKGPAVGVAGYDDPSMRSFADIDLLIRKKNLMNARDTLIADGFSPDYEAAAEQTLIDDQHALELSSQNIKVELHWALLSRHLRFDIDVDDLWARAEKVECAGHTINVLAQHHLFLFLCAHGAKHEWERPRWICDIAQLADRLSEKEVERTVDLARRVGAKRLLALGVRVVRMFFGSHLSVFPPALLERERDTSPILLHVQRRLGFAKANVVGMKEDRLSSLDPRLRVLLFWARCRERLIDRVMCVAQVIFVPTMTDGGIGVARWVGRPVRLAARAVRRLALR
ncbi:MAG TPA: nucleotidyltransferase family protein [Gemmatimonadaceae bacterium]|nr:nucleotidyltransferase family protein [Gemmatimonadaceae bacterium]